MTQTPRPGPIAVPVAGSEIDTLIGALERNRRTFAWKCSGLPAADLRRTVGTSRMTLAGLLKHLALVEDHYFHCQLQGTPRYAPPFDAVDFDTDPDWEWRTAMDDSPEELMALWERFVAQSRANVTAAYDAGGPDVLTAGTWSDGHSPSLRRLMVDLIEEYARHTGHADLIRESIDDLVGEGIPEHV